MGWQNKVIGALELFPVLGPIVALIERAIAAIFCGQGHSSQSGSLKDRLNEYAEKTKTFEKSALAAFNKTKVSTIEQPALVGLTLSAKQEETLTKAVVEIQKNRKPENVTIFGNNGVWVFTIDEIPGMIFKTEKLNVDIGNDFSKRISATEQAKSVIDSEDLHLLHVPKQELLQIKVDGIPSDVLMEQQFDIDHGCRIQEIRFNNCINNEHLQPFIQECTRQLVILIAKTGYKDVRYDNNPILNNGKGLALIDLDTSPSPVTGLLDGCAGGRDGILRCFTSKMLDDIEPLLSELLSKEQFEQLGFSKIKEESLENAQSNTLFVEYLGTRNISTGKEKVHLQDWTLMDTFETRFNRGLQKKINQIAINNFGIYPVEERKFYIYESAEENEQFLNALKENSKIFDWKPFPRFGYTVWC